jgi:catechol 2,3-dioxygenase-like lactoylglutathione lyase family enzyme
VTVPARVSIATLGVRDVATATAFYRALGWELSPTSNDEVSFFRTAGAILGLYGHDALATDAGLDATPAPPFRGTSLAINVESPEAVVAALDAAVAVGGTLLRPAHLAEWGGTSGYFADPDGHAWEVAHNPFFPLDEQGLPQLP